MEAGEHSDLLSTHDVKQRVRETTQNRLSHVPMNVRMGCRKSKDASRCRFDGTRKLGTQANGLVLVPPPRLENVQTGLGTEAEAHGEESALEEFLAEDLPRDGRRRIVPMRFDATV
jgi:hypothetical protein